MKEKISDIPSESRFQKGAITYLDFLGWKGIWKENKKALQDVRKLINDIRKKAKELTDTVVSDDSFGNLSQVISISDTISIFTPEINTLNLSDKEILKIHAALSQYILKRCIDDGYLIRGTITYGSYSFKDNVMIGPGIDECASWYEACDWSGVHFSPSAEFVLKKYCENVPDTI